MEETRSALFDLPAWSLALDRFGAVTHLSVALYDAGGQLVGGPAPVTSLNAVFLEFGYDPGLFSECLSSCLAQAFDDRQPVIVARPSGLAVVGTAFVIEDAVVGAAVAGYAVVDFCDSVSVARLARDGGVPFRRLWDAARHQQPVPPRRLRLHGELLQLLGDTLLRETHRSRQYQETAAALTKADDAKDEFLAILSHELRSPLTPILGWTHVLKGEALPPLVRRAADVIERNALLQLRLVDDLLELNRTLRTRTTLRLTACNLVDELQAAIQAIVEEAVTRQVALRMDESGELLLIQADRDRLQQVFRNVLLNAIKFTGRGGRVDVNVTRQTGVAEVRIRDTGKGISAEFLPFVFDMFRQQEQGARRTHGGLGIGLALVKGLVEAHNGSVSVASEGAGHGTEVTMTFPIAVDATPARAPVLSAIEAAGRLAGVRTLVVEDQEDARDLLGLMLRQFGAIVLMAEDGLGALATLVLEPVDLVFCDLHMPRMDGFAFLAELRRLHGPGHPPVIAVSALADGAEHERTTAAGFDAHLDKPFDTEGLLAVAGAVLARQIDRPFPTGSSPA